MERETAQSAADDPGLEKTRSIAWREASKTPPGSFVGPYKLLEVIGEGGFGVVYLAERREPMVQRVALKIIKPGMDSKAVLARFDQERQALAVMDHANIAKILDAGMTDGGVGAGGNGRPYFVMEHIAGVSINEHCDRHTLPIRERLELFIPVCEAVQHAHHKGIIHRDLKPSNILVTIREGRAVPKVIDFGVAKAMSGSLTEKTLCTGVGEFIGTPEYMSPEQAEMTAQDIDTRSDVYSLGVVLYDLLSGSLPFESALLRAAGNAEVLRIIREVEPERPSTKLTRVGAAKAAAARRVQAAELLRTLKSDLEWIPLRAMRKDRAERYATPLDLARDVRAYLDGRPLQACPPRPMYLLKKFVKRHRRAVGVVGVGALLAIAGATAVIQARIERIREQEARSAIQSELMAINSVNLQVADLLREEGTSQQARGILVEQTMERLEQLMPMCREDGACVAQLANCYDRLAEILGADDPCGRAAGDALARAMELWELRARLETGNAPARSDLASAHYAAAEHKRALLDADCAGLDRDGTLRACIGHYERVREIGDYSRIPGSPSAAGELLTRRITECRERLSASGG